MNAHMKLNKLKASDVHNELLKLSDTQKAQILQRFFKTGKGQYGEGDRFLGVVVPDIRSIVKKFEYISIFQIRILLHSPFHEDRLAGLLMLVRRFETGTSKEKKDVYMLYCDNTKYINNWDLVDLTAPNIVGAYAFEHESMKQLHRFIHSNIVWQRRIAMISTLFFLRHGQSKLTYEFAQLLLADSHDLIHKAVGWMLREAGKRCSEKELIEFLERNASHMPRTMLRYSIERLPKNVGERLKKMPSKFLRRHRVY